MVKYGMAGGERQRRKKHRAPRQRQFCSFRTSVRAFVGSYVTKKREKNTKLPLSLTGKFLLKSIAVKIS